jgi:cyclophilin family peptidyl-prolyl cis-trans isomerase
MLSLDPSQHHHQLCRIPLEIKTAKDKEPVYEYSLEDLGRPNDQPVLPFNAFGTLAWARSEFDNNSASSQVFWLLKESELTPSGANLLDGRYAVFGYVVEVRFCGGSTTECRILRVQFAEFMTHRSCAGPIRSFGDEGRGQD